MHYRSNLYCSYVIIIGYHQSLPFPARQTLVTNLRNAPRMYGWGRGRQYSHLPPIQLYQAASIQQT